eukprot:6713429-Prymnesium_polylepis.2
MSRTQPAVAQGAKHPSLDSTDVRNAVARLSGVPVPVRRASPLADSKRAYINGVPIGQIARVTSAEFRVLLYRSVSHRIVRSSWR